MYERQPSQNQRQVPTYALYSTDGINILEPLSGLDLDTGDECFICCFQICRNVEPVGNTRES